MSKLKNFLGKLNNFFVVNNAFYTSAHRSFATILCMLTVLCVVSDTVHTALYSLDGRSGPSLHLTVVGGWTEISAT